MNTPAAGSAGHEPSCGLPGHPPSEPLSAVGPYCCAPQARQAFADGFGPLAGSARPAVLAGIRLAGALAMRGVEVSLWERSQVLPLLTAGDLAQVQAVAGWLRRARDPLAPDRRRLYPGPYRSANEAWYVFDNRVSDLPTPVDRRLLAVVWLGAALATYRVRLTDWELAQVRSIGRTAPIDAVQALIGLVIRSASRPRPAAELVAAEPTPGRTPR